MRAAAQFVRQLDAADWAGFKLLGVDQDDFRALGFFVGDEAHQVTVVFVLRIHAWGKGCFAGVLAFGQADLPGVAGLQVVFDIAMEQEPAGHLHGAVGIAVRLCGIALVEHAEFQNAIVQALFRGLAGFQVEAPAVQVAAHFFLIQIRHHAFVTRGRAFVIARHGVVLEIAVEHDLVALFVGIEPVQHKGGLGFKPNDVLGLTAPWNDGNA